MAREPEGAWTTGSRRKGNADYRSDKRELHCVFDLILRKLLSKKAMSDKLSMKLNLRVGVFAKLFESGSLPRRTG